MQCLVVNEIFCVSFVMATLDVHLGILVVCLLSIGSRDDTYRVCHVRIH